MIVRNSDGTIARCLYERHGIVCGREVVEASFRRDPAVPSVVVRSHRCAAGHRLEVELLSVREETKT